MKQLKTIAAASSRLARIASALLAFAIFAAGCSHAPDATRPAAAAVVPIVKAEPGSVSPRTVLSGIIAPLQNVGITSSLTEPTDAVYVKEGDDVHRGELLALLDSADLRAQLAQYEATMASTAATAAQTYDQAGLTVYQSRNTINQARAAVRQAQQTLATDTVNRSRDADLLKSGYIAQQTYDAQATLVDNDSQAVRAARVTLQNDKQQVLANGTTTTGLQGAQVSAARATAQISQAQAEQIRVAIEKASVVSPIDGVVVNRNINPGEFPGTRQIFTLQETRRVYAVLNGSAAQIVGLRTGAAAVITSASLRGKQFDGQVDGILSAVNPGSTNFIVKVLLANAAGTLRPGLPVSGSARLPMSSGIRIPDTAFLDTTSSTVQVVNRGVVKTATVTMIADDGKNAIVTGLAPGSVVVINGASGLTDGQPVDPQQVAEK